MINPLVMPTFLSTLLAKRQHSILAMGLGLVIWISSSLCFAFNVAPGYAVTPQGYQLPHFSLLADSAYRFNTEIDDGGELDQTRLLLSSWTRHTLTDAWSVAVHTTYQYDRYDFSGATGFGQLNPWEHVNRLTITMPFIYQPSREWRFTYTPLLQLSVESNGDLGQGISGGGVITMEYQFNDRFALGVLLGGTSRLEDGGELFLLPLFSWHITEGLHFAGKLRDGLPAYLIELSYQLVSGWRVGLGIEAENHRFRLDDSDSAPDGIGDVSTGTLRASLGYRLDQTLQLELYAGAAASEIRLENKRGNTIRKQDTDVAPVVGFQVKGKF